MDVYVTKPIVLHDFPEVQELDAILHPVVSNELASLWPTLREQLLRDTVRAQAKEAQDRLDAMVPNISERIRVRVDDIRRATRSTGATS